MAQQQVLEDEIPARASRRQHGREQQPEHFEHVLSIGHPRRARYCRPTAPGLAAAFTLVFISAWNDYFLALVITFSQSVTLPLYIQAHPQPSVIAASIVPPVVVGLVAQRALTRGLSLGVVDRSGA